MESQNKRKRNRSGVLKPEQADWAYRKWCAGYSIQEIAEKLYVSPSTLYRSFKGRRRKRPPLDPKTE